MWAFEKGIELQKKFEIAKAAGFDGVEPNVGENADIDINASDKHIKDFKNTADSFGLNIPSVLCPMLWSFPLSSADVDKRKKAIDITKRSLYTAKVLGADTMLTIPGIVGAEFIPGSERLNYKSALENAFESIDSIKGYAKDLGVYIGLENVWNKFLLSPDEMKRFVDSFNSEYIGTYLDVGNVIPFGYPDQWILLLGKRIKKVHLKDFRRSVGNIDGFVDLLSGDVDFIEVIRSLKAIGYDDYLTAEVFPNKFCPEVIVYNTANAMDAILKKV